MRGRKPKPTALKLIEGNPGKRKINQNEPKPKQARPTCPAWLSKEAKAEWKRIVPELERLGLLTIVDRAALASYCTAWGHLRQAQEVINKAGPGGPVYRTEAGDIKPMPHVAWANKAMVQIRSFCSEFGLSPSSRCRMAMPQEESQADGMERLLGG